MLKTTNEQICFLVRSDVSDAADIPHRIIGIAWLSPGKAGSLGPNSYRPVQMCW